MKRERDGILPKLPKVEAMHLLSMARNWEGCLDRERKVADRGLCSSSANNDDVLYIPGIQSIYLFIVAL